MVVKKHLKNMVLVSDAVDDIMLHYF